MPRARMLLMVRNFPHAATVLGVAPRIVMVMMVRFDLDMAAIAAKAAGVRVPAARQRAGQRTGKRHDSDRAMTHQGQHGRSVRE